MLDIPEPRYVTADDGVSIAYQVFGSGRCDLVWLPGNATQLDVNWELPANERFMRDLARLGRVIVIDRRGVGLSDRMRPDDLPPLEVHVSDLLLVLDAVRSRDTVLIGNDEGVHMAVIFAASHPGRLRGLVLFAPRPSMVATDAFPWGGDQPEWDTWLAWVADHWGSRESIIHDLHELSPQLLGDEDAIAWGAKIQRAAVSPSAAVALFRQSMGLDIADVLPTVRTSALVMHRSGDAFVPVEAGRAVAGLLPEATFIELPGEDHFMATGSTDSILEALASFIHAEPAAVDPSRRLATVLFTDIVRSTAHAARLGDVAWKDLVERHHAEVRHALAAHGGREVSTAGDGFFASFEGPAAATRSAVAIVRAVRDLGLEIRAGVHTGEVETIDDEIGGLAVTIGARIGAMAGPSEVLVSSTVRDLTAGSGLSFEDAGEHELKGIPDHWRLYRVVGS